MLFWHHRRPQCCRCAALQTQSTICGPRGFGYAAKTVCQLLVQQRLPVPVHLHGWHLRLPFALQTTMQSALPKASRPCPRCRAQNQRFQHEQRAVRRRQQLLQQKPPWRLWLGLPYIGRQCRLTKPTHRRRCCAKQAPLCDRCRRNVFHRWQWRRSR